jgi:methionine--tRNA ligase beta chain
MTDKVNFNDWSKIDLRVGKILNAEDIENADKLYRLEVDLGKEIGKRTLCAGLKQYYSKEDLLGKKIIVFVNLEPRMMKGIKSEGMLLAACTDNHEKVILLAPEKDIELGSRVS